MVQKYKVVFLGDQASGKTSLVRRYRYDTFEDSVSATIGMDFQSKNVQIGGKTLRLQLWDTAGQERFRSLIPSYMRDANAAVVVFDITSRQTFEAVQTWIDYVRSERGEAALVTLVGNKLDLACERQVSKEEATKLAEDIGIRYVETSAKVGDNVEQLFTDMAAYLLYTSKPEDQAGDAAASGAPKIQLSAAEQTAEADARKKAKCQC